MIVNPVGFCYSSTKGVLDNAAPGWIFIPDQHRDDPVYAQAQALGADVTPYLDVCEDKVRGKLDEEFRAFAFQNGAVPLWGNNRKSDFPLLDMRVGSEYVKRAVAYIAERIMPRFGGIMLDVVGAQLFSAADWKNWPVAERAAWSAGNVDFVRLLDIERRRIKPWFKIVNNNHWDEAREGAQYVDGIVLENHNPAGDWAQAVVNRSYGYLGQRRVIAIAKNEADALAFAALPGVTHVTAVDRSKGHNYKTLTPPVVKPQDNRLIEAQAMREWLHANRGNDAEAESLRAELADLRTQLEQVRTERNDARAEIEELEQQIEMLQQRALSATNSLDTSVAALRSAIEQLSGGTPE